MSTAYSVCHYPIVTGKLMYLSDILALTTFLCIVFENLLVTQTICILHQVAIIIS